MGDQRALNHSRSARVISHQARNQRLLAAGYATVTALRPIAEAELTIDLRDMRGPELDGTEPRSPVRREPEALDSATRRRL